MRFIGLLALAFLLPACVHADALININTADKAALMTLTGLGGTGAKAQAVIDYRNQYGSFSVIEDIMNVKGIGQATFDGFKDYITVGDVATSTSAPEASSTPSSSNISTYVPPPAVLTIEAGPDVVAHLEVPFTFMATAKMKSGAIDTSAIIRWSFGDGSSGEGSVVEKTYHYAGTYLVVITARDGSTTARDDVTVVVKPAIARIAAITGEGITLANDSSERLDLSGWRLTTDAGSYRLPEGTMLLPNSSVLFPYTILNLPISFNAGLTYPNGVSAARYAPSTPVAPVVAMQPSVVAPSYESVQKVEKIISPRTNVQSNDEAGGAPTAATELAAVGAALPPELGTATKSTPSLLRSPWTLSFLGLMALAGGAFILL